MRLVSTVAAVTLMLATGAVGQELREGAVLLRDDFDRFATPAFDLAKVPGTSYAWGKRVPVADGKPLPVISGNARALNIAYSSGTDPHDTGVYVAAFKVADGVITLTVGPSAMADRGHEAIVSYRAREPQAAAGGFMPGAYHVDLVDDWSGSRDVVLRYGSEPLAVGDVAETHPPAQSYRVKVAFAGDFHCVWVDDRPVISYWETAPNRTAAGFVGFGGWYSAGSFDDFEVRSARLVATPGARPSGEFAPLLYQGRPYFVLGTYDAPDEADLGEWRDAGGNTVIVPCLTEKTPRERRARLQSLADWGTRNQVAMVYYPAFDPYSKEGAKSIPTTPAEVPAKARLYREMLAVTAKHPQTLGYWTFDEPENNVYEAYKDWAEKRDTGLAEWIAGGMKWTYDTLHAGDPDAYVMPTIAWWTTYQGMAPLYDVNVPNEYPQVGPPLSGPLYNAVYDAAKAADAVQATGRSGVVYMPGIFDVIEPPYRGATVAELRYLYFAPLTQGAVGLLPWRLGRCSLEYRRGVVYPAMREVKRLVPWLMGEWQEGRVTSDHDQATVPYLKEFPVRVKTLPGQETTETVQVAGVPDVSYLLRRRPTNSYLLLAVSNRREPIEVTFSLKGIPGLPATAREMLQWAETPIKDAQIKDTFAPCGVKAWVIEAK
jgi:hypothetical protein